MPWYKSGTVSVVLNSNAVIGTSTAFIANSRVGDAFRGPDGGWYEVINIVSDTAMAISPNYQGATNAAGTYALAPMQGYVKDSADALRSLVNQYGAKLAALGTTGNYDVLPVNKGGTGGTSVATAQTGLDLTPQSSATDLTANRVLKTGAFGLGVPLNATDANTCTLSGATYRLNSPFTNGPTAGPYSISVMAYDNEVSQLAFREGVVSPVVFYRKRTGPSTWGGWERSAKADAAGIVPIAQGGTGTTSMGAGSVGTVSQASGVPTGAIIEKGTNANGDYIRYADGTQICWKRIGTTSLTNPSASLFITAQCVVGNYAAPFVAVPTITAMAIVAGYTWAVWAASATEPSATSWGNWYGVSGATNTNGAILNLIAVGRWF